MDHVIVSRYGIFVIETKNYQSNERGLHPTLGWR
ncbi:nuclease-related domain-containing protein [Psychrobacter faecalis]